MPSQLEDYKDRKSKKSGGATDELLKSDPVPLGKRYCFQRVTFEDKTSAFTSLRVYIEGHGYEHTLAHKTGPQAATPEILKDPLYLIPRERLVGKFTGTSDGDALEMCITGYWEVMN